jgi:hypothetical protein
VVTSPLPPPDPGTAVPPPRRHHVVGWVALAVVMVLAVAAGVLLYESRAPEPGPFYDPPTDLADAAPGDVLRAESFDPAIGGAEGWRVLYRTTAPDGSPAASSGVVLAPAADPVAADRPVVAWDHPTTGVARGCAPSLLPDPTVAMFGASEAIANGWVWAATDYPGLGTPGPHPYLIGESLGRATLDMVRAARQLPTGATNRFATWGHSEGGQASLWAGILAGDYAPDLDLVAVSAAAPAIELADLVAADEGTAAGKLLLSMGLVAWSELYPDASLDVALTSVARPLARNVAAACIETQTQVEALAPRVLAAQALPFAAVDLTTTDPWARILAENTPTGAIDVPLLVGQGLDDKVVVPATTRAALVTRCADGEQVTFETLPGVGHLEAGRVFAPTAMSWLGQRFAGEPAASNCDALPTVPAGR